MKQKAKETEGQRQALILPKLNYASMKTKIGTLLMAILLSACVVVMLIVSNDQKESIERLDKLILKQQELINAKNELIDTYISVKYHFDIDTLTNQ